MSEEVSLIGGTLVPSALVWREAGGSPLPLGLGFLRFLLCQRRLNDLRHPYFLNLRKISWDEELHKPFSFHPQPGEQEYSEEATSKLTAEEVSSWGQEAAHAEAWR